MADVFTQISKRTGQIKRVPRGETPVIEMRLASHQYVANVALNSREYHPGVDPDRKTVDWDWTAFVVTPLGDDVDG